MYRRRGSGKFRVDGGAVASRPLVDCTLEDRRARARNLLDSMTRQSLIWNARNKAEGDTDLITAQLNFAAAPAGTKTRRARRAREE